MAYERVEGSLGPRGDWERMAQLLALLTNVHRDVKKYPQPFSPSAFLPWVEREQMTPARFRAQFAHLIEKKPAKKGAKR